MAKVVQEEVQINQATDGVTMTDGTANVDTTIAKYIVPDKSQIEIRATDFIAMYLADATPTELGATSQVTILKTDAMGRRTRVLAQGEYQQFKEFQDSLKKYFFKGKTVIIEAKWQLLIKVLATAAPEADNCRFTLSCKLVYETLE